MEALPEPDMPVITTSCVGVSCGRLRERLALPTGFAEVATSRYYHAKLGTIARIRVIFAVVWNLRTRGPSFALVEKGGCLGHRGTLVTGTIWLSFFRPGCHGGP